MAQTPLPCFSNLVSKVESFELFQKSLETPVPSTIAFTANRTSSHRGGDFSRHKRGHRNGSSNDSLSHGQGHANTTKVAVHHAARFVAWKDILQIGVGNAMIGMNPRCNL